MFSHGVSPINVKAEALDPFKYHVTIENYIGEHPWTEKLSDAFLGMTLPFYYGATNAGDCFSADSFITIDPNNHEKSLAVIKDALETNQYEKRQGTIKELRRLVMEEYNIFAVVARHVTRLHSLTGKGDIKPILYSRHDLRRRSWKIAFSDFAEKIRSKLGGLPTFTHHH